MTPRRVSILGSTGSIGQNTLDLIRRRARDFSVVALTGGRNVAQLAADAREFGVEIAVTAHDECLNELRDALSGSGVMAAAGAQALLKELGGVLGLTFAASGSRDMVAAEPFIELLIEVRSQLREANQYAVADDIRTKLTQMGVAVEDGPDGVTWRFRQPDGS